MLTILLQLIDDPADKQKFEDLYSRYEWLMVVRFFPVSSAILEKLCPWVRDLWMSSLSS